jgi:hypothetical protein
MADRYVHHFSLREGYVWPYTLGFHRLSECIVPNDPFKPALTILQPKYASCSMVFSVDDNSFGYTLRLGVEFLFGFFSILLLLVHFLEQPGRVRNIGVEYQFGIGVQKTIIFSFTKLGIY